MRAEEVLLRLLYRALLDIRMASSSGDTRRAAHIANLMHNVPLAMLSEDKEVVLKQLMERAQLFESLQWVEAALADMRRLNS
jgi:hypothetical protein